MAERIYLEWKPVFRSLTNPFGEQYYPLPEDAWRSKITLKKVMLEIADKPVTFGKVEQVLGWLDTHIGRIKPTTKRFEKDLAPEERVFPRDFIKDIRK